MPTLAPDAGSSLFTPQMLQLLQNAIGGTTDTNTGQTGTGSNTQTSTGGQTTNTQGNTAGNTSQQTQSTADVSALQQIFAQQQAGITPEMLKAIFTEGSKAAPGLVNATANAVGARSGGNTPLATALGNLSSQITGKAAELDLAQKNASAQTAAEIARLTAGSTTTGTTNQTNNTTGTQTNNNITQGTSNTATSGSTQTDTNPNYGNAAQLIAMLAGGSALGGAGGLGSLLSGLAGGQGGAGGGLAALLQQGGSGLLNLLGLGPQAPTNPNTPADVTNTGNASVLPGEGQTLTPQQIDEFLAQYNSGGGGLSGAGLDEFLASLEGDLGSTETILPVTDNENWWADEGWDQIDWSMLAP